MKLCQIIPYGGEDLWIKLALREFPETKWLIILSSGPKKPLKAKHIEVEKKREQIETIDFYERAKKVIKELKEEEKLIPEEKQRKISLIEPIDSDNYYENLKFFRALLKIIKEQGFKIAIHLGSALMIWRLALYNAAIEYKSSIELLYLFQKETGNIQKLWIYRDLSQQEKLILEILSNNLKLSVTEIQEQYFTKTKTGKLSYILKLVKGLVKDGILLEEKEGRTRKVELSPIGRSLGEINEYFEIIKKQISS